MILDGVCYPVIHFYRVMLSRMVKPSCSQPFLVFSVFYQTPVSPFQYYAVHDTFFTSSLSRLSTLWRGRINTLVPRIPNVPWKESEAVPEGHGLVLQQEKFGSGQPTLADGYRMMEELFDKSDRYWTVSRAISINRRRS